MWLFVFSRVTDNKQTILNSKTSTVSLLPALEEDNTQVQVSTLFAASSSMDTNNRECKLSLEGTLFLEATLPSAPMSKEKNEKAQKKKKKGP